MFIYLGMFAYSALGAVANSLRDVEARRGQFWLTGILLVVIIGFRWHVGADWYTYNYLLDNARLYQLGILSAQIEPGYALLDTIAAEAGWGLWFPDLVCAILFTYGLVLFCRQQPNPWLAMVVAVPYLVIGVAMGFTRQSAAVGLIMVALVNSVGGHPVRTFIALGFATLFHTSAIVLVPLFAITNVTRGPVTAVILVIFTAALYFVFSSHIDARMSEYRNSQYLAGGAIPRVLMNVVAAVIFLTFRRRFSNAPGELRLWTLWSLLTFLTIPLLFILTSTTVVDRLGIFLVPLQLFVLSRVPLVFGRNRRQNTGLMLAVILYSLAAELIWLNLGNESRSWLPYRNYLWENFGGTGI